MRPGASGDVRLILVLSGIALLALPPARHLLEASMAGHMLVQLPVLAGLGWMVGTEFRRRAAARVAALDRWNGLGIPGLIAASVTMLVWMLPRTLDAARLSPAWEIAKFVSVPLTGGFAARMSWALLPGLGRAVVHLELIATLWRAGWAYFAADARLCASYLWEDQRFTGWALLWLGAAYAIAVGWRPLFGPRVSDRATDADAENIPLGPVGR